MSDSPRLPDPRMIPMYSTGQWPGPNMASEPTAEADTADNIGLLRPFIVTEGRTRPLQDGLRIETLIHALPAALSAPLQFERRRIVEVCQTPLSVAEISSAIGVPLGVARVLIGDLITGNFVSAHQPSEMPLHIIERITDLVRAL
jgi:hypothetical protein